MSGAFDGLKAKSTSTRVELEVKAADNLEGLGGSSSVTVEAEDDARTSRCRWRRAVLPFTKGTDSGVDRWVLGSLRFAFGPDLTVLGRGVEAGLVTGAADNGDEGGELGPGEAAMGVSIADAFRFFGERDLELSDVGWSRA